MWLILHCKLFAVHCVIVFSVQTCVRNELGLQSGKTNFLQ